MSGAQHEIQPDATPFLKGEPPLLDVDQLDLFTSETVHAQEMMTFDPDEALAKLETRQGDRVVMVDLGGDKVSGSLGTLSGLDLEVENRFGFPVKSSAGRGYGIYLKALSQQATQQGLPVGVSSAGVTEGTKLLASPNAAEFVAELEEEHEGDFANLFPTLGAFYNDAVAGLISAAIEANKRDEHTRDVILVINGGGLGAAVLLGDRMLATEAGHVPVTDKLNPYGQDKPCGMFGSEQVCIENVAASGAGIERTWQDMTGEPLSGVEIEQRYDAGAKLAAGLYENSALATAHVIRGLANVFDLDLADPSTAVVGHGGGFKFQNYGDRVAQILGRSVGTEPRMLSTHSYSPNACADGAGKAALINTVA